MSPLVDLSDLMGKWCKVRPDHVSAVSVEDNALEVYLSITTGRATHQRTFEYCAPGDEDLLEQAHGVADAIVARLWPGRSA